MPDMGAHTGDTLNANPAVGLIDLGSNSVRLLVVRINPNKSHTVLTRHKQMVRLGQGAFETKMLSEAAMARTIAALRNIAEICRGYDVTEVVALATAAVRDARNGAEFVERAEAESGVRLAAISGLEEARLIHLGVATGLPERDETDLFLDIGGGSTELVVGRGTRFLHLDSLKLGAVRVTSAHPVLAAGGAVPRDAYDAVRSGIRSSALRSVQKIVSYRPRRLVGSSGTIQNLAEIAARAKKGGDGDLLHVSLKNLTEVARRLCEVSLEQRARIPGINPQRADIIVGGAAILQTLMEELGMNEISVSGRGLLDGMLYDYLSRGTYGYLVEGASVREQSVLQLARSTHADEVHAAWVAMLATDLYDSAREIGLHTFGLRERELLHFAGVLHDVGLFLSFSNHHAHSRYLIKNSELLGFNRDEVEIIAAATYFHRKWSPRKNASDAEYLAMDKGDRRRAVVLGLFLRMAENLERSQQQVVRRARFLPAGKRRVTLDIAALQPAMPELEAVEQVKGSFRKILGYELEVVSSLM